MSKNNNNKIFVISDHHFGHEKILLLEYFDDLHGTFYHKGLIFSHFPVHESSFGERFNGNVHGHTHHRTVKERMFPAVDDLRYLNVSIESPHRFMLGVEYGVPIEISVILEYFNG